jgi:ketosteroid isomerase-like protein
LEELAARQWQVVWPNTTDFEFEYSSAVGLMGADQAAVLASWNSTGLEEKGSGFARRGRATIILRNSVSGWKAVHTHFSMEPPRKHDSFLCQPSGTAERLY